MLEMCEFFIFLISPQFLIDKATLTVECFPLNSDVFNKYVKYNKSKVRWNKISIYIYILFATAKATQSQTLIDL